jgi:WD40 repeat protein
MYTLSKVPDDRCSSYPKPKEDPLSYTTLFSYDSNAALDANSNIYKGHAGGVTTIAILPDGSLLSGSDDNSIIRWRVGQVTPLEIYTGHSGPVRCLAILPDGFFLSASGDNSIIRWRVGQVTPMDRYNGPTTSRVKSLAVLPDGSILSGLDGSTISRWRVGQLTPLEIYEGDTGLVTSMAILPDGSFLSAFRREAGYMSDIRDNKIIRWRIGQITPLEIYNGHTDLVMALAILPELCKWVQA